MFPNHPLWMRKHGWRARTKETATRPEEMDEWLVGEGEPPPEEWREGGREDEDGTAGPGAWRQFVLFLLWFSDAPIRLVPSVPPAVYFQLR